MAERDPAPAPKSRQPEQDAYLAACSALLHAMATDSTVEERHVDTLLDAMPDVDLRDGLRVWLKEAGLRDPWCGKR